MFIFAGDLTQLSRFGLSEGRSVTLELPSTGADSLEGTLRGYHLLPPGRQVIAAAALKAGNERDAYFEDSLKNADTIVIYLHGNGATRAHHRRVAVQKHIAAHCRAHVLTFDYRGYGDSIGSPSEASTAEDVGAILAYLQSLNIGESAKVFLYAESLGTGIAIAYLSVHPEMGQPAGGPVSGLLLLAPFVSLPEAALSHPVAAPFRLFPVVKNFMYVTIVSAIIEYAPHTSTHELVVNNRLQHLHYKYPSIETISKVEVPILFMHGTDDIMIPTSHSKRLHEVFARDRQTGGPITGECSGTDSPSKQCKADPSKYVEISNAGHDDLFMTQEWLLEVSAFMEQAP